MYSAIYSKFNLTFASNPGFMPGEYTTVSVSYHLVATNVPIPCEIVSMGRAHIPVFIVIYFSAETDLQFSDVILF